MPKTEKSVFWRNTALYNIPDFRFAVYSMYKPQKAPFLFSMIKYMPKPTKAALRG
jgi:hypothetical protein